MIYPACRIHGFAAVFWPGNWYADHFRQPHPHGSLYARWTTCSASEGTDSSVPVTDVYEDPKLPKQTKVSSVDRLIDPDDAPKIPESGPGGHKYSGMNKQDIHYSTLSCSSNGRWWPVWLIVRTKKGRWTICWYQLLDGAWAVEFWWYHDTHIHLLEAVR